MSKPLALIVDDEPDIIELLRITLQRMEIDAVTAENLSQARSLLDKHNYFLCLSDMRLPDGDGIELVELIQESYSHIPVAVITAYGNVEGAVNTLKAGAFDYVSKPVDLQMLRSLVNRALKLAKPSEASSDTMDQFLGDAPVMQALRTKITKLARSQAPVFIHGPSGSGKELVARLIHEQGPRAEGPFIPVNCGAIPSELMESEFFGHRKGSFTGAVADKEGLFQAADGGTLFLDEVADLPLPMQVKLLRVIQEKTVRAIGDQNETPVDVRILSASHKNLSELVETAEFRQDLFYRINVIDVHVPSLAERSEDIEVLAEYIITNLAKQHGIAKPKISKECLSVLKQYHFPGNIRELENILERALTLCDSEEIGSDDLHLPSVTEQQTSEEDEQDLNNYLNDQERQLILQALEKCKWNRTLAAKELGITFRALRYRLKKFGIE